MALRTKPRAAIVHARSGGRRLARPVRTYVDWARSRDTGADLALFHEYAPPPSGGGNQFVRALAGELERRRLALEWNRISGGTPACLFNSFNFDAARLRRFARSDVRMVHRVDGPIGVYRGFDDGTDRRILELNSAFAHATIFQSEFSRTKHEELGLDLRDPIVIPNAPDPAIFHPPWLALRWAREAARDRHELVVEPAQGSRTCWSGSIGGSARSESTSRSPARLMPRSRTSALCHHLRLSPLADLLREHDVYLAASRDDPCSNALLEALACGLPGGLPAQRRPPRARRRAGIGFDEVDELPGVFTRLREELEGLRAAIRVPALSEVTDRYLEVLRV